MVLNFSMTMLPSSKFVLHILKYIHKHLANNISSNGYVDHQIAQCINEISQGPFPYNIKLRGESNYLTSTLWKLYFDVSTSKEGQCIGIVIISLNGAIFEMLSRLNYYCINNKVKYEALLFSLKIL